MNGRASHIERELKLGVPSGFSLARLPAQVKEYVASPAEFKRLHTVYYDSSDFRLARWGCSLRYRQGEAWTLKIPVLDTSGGDALARIEHTFAGRFDEIPPAAIELATAFLRGKPVGRVAELRTVRVKREFRCNGNGVAEVVEDDVRVVEGTRVAERFAQMEIELTKDAAADALDAIAAALRSEGAGDPDPLTKNVRALHIDGAPEIEVAEIGPDASIGDVVRAALGSAVVQLIRCDPLMRTSNDVEAVHKARVSVRKIRSYLRTFVPVLDERWALDLRERLRWLQDLFAPVRDADVFADRMRSLSEQLPHPDIAGAAELLRSLERNVIDQHETLRRRLNDPHYVELLEALVTAVREPHFTRDPSERAATIVAAIMQGVYKKTRKAVRKSGRRPSDRALHRIRIKSKHLRYAAEAFCGVAVRDADRYAETVESIQEILGLHHDGVVALTRLRSFDMSPAARFTAGELGMLAYSAGLEACREWRSVWRKIKSKRNRFW